MPFPRTLVLYKIPLQNCQEGRLYGVGSIYTEKGQEVGRRESPRRLLTLPRTFWFLPPWVRTRDPDLPNQASLHPSPSPRGSQACGDGRSCYWQKVPMGAVPARLWGSCYGGRERMKADPEAPAGKDQDGPTRRCLPARLGAQGPTLRVSLAPAQALDAYWCHAPCLGHQTLEEPPPGLCLSLLPGSGWWLPWGNLC